MSASKVEISRKPKVVIIELEKGSEPIIRDIYLKSAPAGEDVLDRTMLEKEKSEKIEYQSLKSLIESNANSEYVSVKKIIENVAKDENIDINVRNHALKLIEEVELNV